MDDEIRDVEVSVDAINRSKIAVTLTMETGRHSLSETLRLTRPEAERVYTELGTFLGHQGTERGSSGTDG